MVETAHQIAVDGYRFGYGDVVTLNQQWSYRNAPYVVSQGTGAFAEIPDLLDTSHTVETRADAEAYLARLDAYAAALDGETAQMRHDGAMGVIPPAFILDKTIRQMKSGRGAPIAEWGLVTSLAKRAAAAKLAGDPGARALKLATERVAPAIDRQIAELTRLRAGATSDAGVWKLPEGEAYYAWALRAATTSSRTPDEVHKLGLEQVGEPVGADGYAAARAGADQGQRRRTDGGLGQGPAPPLPQHRRGPGADPRLRQRAGRRHAHAATARVQHAGARKAGDQARARSRSRRARRAAMPPQVRSTAASRAIITSTCATPASGPSSHSRP